MGLIIASALAFGIGALLVLFWAVSGDQYEDLEGDAARILMEDPDDRLPASPDIREST